MISAYRTAKSESDTQLHQTFHGAFRAISYAQRSCQKELRGVFVCCGHKHAERVQEDANHS